MTNTALRWFAIVWLEHGCVAGGYALDYRPEEKVAYENSMDRTSSATSLPAPKPWPRCASV